MLGLELVIEVFEEALWRDAGLQRLKGHTSIGIAVVLIRVAGILLERFDLGARQRGNRVVSLQQGEASQDPRSGVQREGSAVEHEVGLLRVGEVLVVGGGDFSEDIDVLAADDE